MKITFIGSTVDPMYPVYQSTLTYILSELMRGVNSIGFIHKNLNKRNLLIIKDILELCYCSKKVFMENIYS